MVMRIRYSHLLSGLLLVLVLCVSLLFVATVTADSHDVEGGTGGQGTEEDSKCPHCVPPPAPSGFSATAQSRTSIRASWTGISGASKYEVIYWEDTGPQDRSTTTIETTSTFHTATGLKCNTDYNFTVRAFGDGSTYVGWGPKSNASEDTQTCPTAPAPTGLQVSRTSDAEAELSWDSVTDAGAYRIEHRINNSGAWSQVTTNHSNTSYTVRGLSCGVDYSFRVSARGDGYPYSLIYGVASSSVSTERLCKPPTPTGLSATALSGSSIRFSWSSISGVSSYEIAYWEDTGGPPRSTITQETSSTSYTATGLECNTDYNFTVRAYGNGTTYLADWGNKANGSGRTQVCPDAPAPTGLQVSRTSDSVAELGWDSVTDAASYQIERRIGSGGWSIIGTRVGETNTSYRVTGLRCGTDYSFRVSARGDGHPYSTSYGDASSGVDSDRLCRPPTPTGLSATALSGTSIRFSWNGISGVSSYEIAYWEDTGGPPRSTMTHETSSTSYTATGLECNTDYNFTVRAYGNGTTYLADWGNKANGSGDTDECPDAPAPTGLWVSRTVDAEAELSWDSVTDVASYQIERRIGTGRWSVIGTRVGDTNTSYTAMGLRCGTEYEFRVSARGDGHPYSTDYGDPSSEVSSLRLCKPPTPTGFNATALDDSSIEVSWDPESGVSKWEVSYWEDTGGPPRSTTDIEVYSNLYDITGLICGTDYNLTVRAYGDGSTYLDDWGPKASAFEETEECPRAPPPDTPTSYRTSSSVAELNWDTVTDAAAYRVERRTGTTGSWVQLTTNHSSTTYNTSSLRCDTVYYFRVSARGDGYPYSLIYGQPSGEVRVQLCLPPAPENFVANIMGMHTAELVWDSLDGAADYRVGYQEDTGVHARTTKQGVHGEGETVSGLECNTTYNFTVEAYGDNVLYRQDWGPAAEDRGKKTNDCPRAPPPANLRSTRTGENVELAWDARTEAYGYQVEMRESDSTTWNVIGTNNGQSNTTIPVSNLDCDTVYYFRVSARGDGHPHSLTHGEPSGEVRVQLCLPPAPDNFVAMTVGRDSIKLTWDDLPEATKYKISYWEDTGGPPRSTMMKELPAGSTMHEVTGLKCGTDYNFTLRAFGDDIKYRSDWGLIAPGDAPTEDCPTAPAPDNLLSARNLDGTAALSWDPVTDAEAYEVELYTKSTDSWDDLIVGHMSASYMTMTALDCEDTFKFRVKSRGDGHPYSLVYGDASAEADIELCLPPAPTGVTVNILGETSASLSWDHTVGTDDYEATYREDTGTMPHSVRQFEDMLKPSHTFTGLDCNTRYVFSVRLHGDGVRYRADWGPAEEKRDTTNPCTPEITIAADDPDGTVYEGDVIDFTLTATYPPTSNITEPATDLIVSINVNDPDSVISGSPLTQVVIKANTSSAGFSIVTDAGAPSMGGTVTVTLQPGTGYRLGAPSTETVTVEDPSMLPPPTVYGMPSSTFESVTLTWNAVDSASVYRVEYRETPNGEWELGDVVEEPDPEPMEVTHTQDGLECSTKYEFRVRSGRGDVANPAWGTDASTPVEAETGVLCAPTGLRSTAQTSYTATLEWDAVTDVDAFQVQHRLAGTGSWGSGGTVVEETTAHIVKDLECDTQYEFRVTSAEVSSLGIEALGGSAMTEPIRTDAACLPTVTIEAVDIDSEVNEGEDVEFKVSRDHAPASALVVDVDVTQIGEFIEGMIPASAIIPANSDSTILTIGSEADDVVESDGSVTITLDTNSTYVLGTPSEATVIVIDITLPAPTNVEVETPDLSLNLTTHDTLIVNWDEVTGADGYRVQRHISTGANDPFHDPIHSGWEDVASDDVKSNRLEVMELDCNTEYIFRVHGGTGGYLDDPWKPGAGATDWESTSNLCAPPALTVSEPASTPGITSVDLSWTRLTGVADFYRISYQKLMPKANPSDPSVPDGPPVEIMGTHNGPEYTVEGLDCDTWYEFRVQSGRMDLQELVEWGGTVSREANTDDLCIPNLRVSTTSPPGSSSVTVEWDAVAGAERYRLEYRKTAEAAWKQKLIEPVKTEHTFQSLECDVSYDFRIQSGRGDQMVGSVEWSDFSDPPVTVSTDTSAQLCPPQDLTVTPLPLRKARLSWTGDSNADGFVVEARDPSVSNTPPDPWNTWTALGGGTACCEIDIDLDDILHSRGLAHADSYEIRIKSTVAPSRPLDDSLHSNTITIIDNPILTQGQARATGDDRALIEWDAISSVKEYVVRYRLLGDSPSPPTFHWETSWPEFATWPYYEVGETEGPFLPPSSTRVSRTIETLESEQIYAFQVNYVKKVNDTKVFSVRDAYVWISNEFPGERQRVGTYPFFGHHDQRAFDYVICQSDFPTEYWQVWQTIIMDAFGEWETATDGFITVRRASGSCASGGTMENLIMELDDSQSEVRMLDTQENRSIWSLPEVKSDVFKGLCLSNPNTPACTTSFTGYTGVGHDSAVRQAFLDFVEDDDLGNLDRVWGLALLLTTGFDRKASNTLPGVDVTFNRKNRDGVEMFLPPTPSETGPGTKAGSGDLNRPSNVSVNMCLPDYPYKGDPDGGYKAYTIAVHEAGHALGLADISLLEFWQPYDVAHPTIPDAAMNYDHEAGNRYPLAPAEFREPDCSPHPFDIMAIFALYGSVAK